MTRTAGTLLVTHPGDGALLFTRAASAAAWVGLLALAVLGGAGAGHAAHAPHPGPAAGGSVTTLALWAAGYGLMVVAMMWPMAARAAALVARRSFPSRRAAHVGILLAVPTLLWLAFGAVLFAVTAPLGALASPWWPATCLAVALALTWHRGRARLLRACADLPPTLPGGRRGLASTAHAGRVFWGRCALLCGPVMAAMVTHHSLAVMAMASAAMWWERWHPRASHDPLPRALLASALVAVLGGLP